MYSSMPNVVVCVWIKTYLRWTQLVNMNALANKALPTVSNNSTQFKPNVHTSMTSQQFITLIMNEILIFEKSWEAGSRRTNKVDAIADKLLKGVSENLKEKMYYYVRRYI